MLVKFYIEKLSNTYKGDKFYEAAKRESDDRRNRIK